MGEAEAKGLKATTIKNRLAYLRGALAWAQKAGIVTTNAAALAEAPQPERRGQAISPEQTRLLFDVTESSHLGILWKLCLGLGLRLGEACGLQWADVDLETRSVAIKQQLQQIDGEWRLVEPKSKTSLATLPIPAFVAEALHRHRAWQAERRLYLGGLWPLTDLVVTGRAGRPVVKTTAWDAFQRGKRKAGLPEDLRIHDLRHSCASLLLEAGEPMRVVQAMLRHSNISITMDLYTHVRETIQERAAGALDNIVTGRSAKRDFG